MVLNSFIFIVLWMGVMALFFQYVKVEEPMQVMGKMEIRTALWAAVLVVIPLVYMTTKRPYIGDTYTYELAYKRIPDTWSEMLEYAGSRSKDKSFTYLQGFIKLIFRQDYRFYFFVLAVLQVSSLISVYRKYSPNYLIPIFLFIVSTDYISWMYNGIRQFTAVTIIFAGTTWLLEKKYIHYVLLILFASTFHRSALLMIPVIFIVSGEPWNKRTLFMLLGVLLIVIYVDAFTDLLDSSLEETQYENVVSDWKAWKDDGTNPFRVLVYSVPAVLSFVGRKYIHYENDRLINISTNMSIVTAGLYVISMVTSGIFIGRLPIYTSLFNYFLLPWEIDHMFSEESRKLLRILMVVCYLLFYYYQMHITSKLI